MRTLIAHLKMLAFAILCILVVPVQGLVLLFTKGKTAYTLPYLWHKIICHVFRIKIICVGAPHKGHQTLYMSNHVSYLDIPVLGGLIKASFVAKKDVASWPVFGFLSRLQQTAFISRDRHDAAKEKNALDNMLNIGKSLIIFPEGTSTDGRDVLPFKSSLFSIAYKDNLPNIHVQPVSIKMTEVDKGQIESQSDRDIYSWHINMDTPLGPHLWHFAKKKGAVITVTFHDAFPAREYENRKTLAKACHKAVSNGVT